MLSQTLFTGVDSDYRWVSIDENNDWLVVAEENNKNVILFRHNGS